MTWYPLPLPPLAGRRYLVTGANAGLGFFTAARLAGAGAHVVLSGRSRERLDAAAAAIRGARHAASLETLVMDQSSLASVDGTTSVVVGGAVVGGAVFVVAGGVDGPGVATLG